MPTPVGSVVMRPINCTASPFRELNGPAGWVWPNGLRLKNPPKRSEDREGAFVVHRPDSDRRIQIDQRPVARGGGDRRLEAIAQGRRRRGDAVGGLVASRSGLPFHSWHPYESFFRQSKNTLG